MVQGSQYLSCQDWTSGFPAIVTDDPDCISTRVNLTMPISTIAWQTGVWRDFLYTPPVQAFRDLLLIPSHRDIVVNVMIQPWHRQAHLGEPESGLSARKIGLVPSSDLRRWRAALGGRAVKGVVFLDLLDTERGTAEVRVRRAFFNGATDWIPNAALQRSREP